MSGIDLFGVSRGLTRLGRRRDLREQIGLPSEESSGGVTFLLDDLMRCWAADLGIRRESVQDAIQKFMYHDDNSEEMRFQLREGPEGMLVFVANSRHQGDRKGKGKGFKGKDRGKDRGKGHGRDRSPRHDVRDGLKGHGSRGRHRNRSRSPGGIRRGGRDRSSDRSLSATRRRRSPSDSGGQSQVVQAPPHVKRPPPPIKGKGGNGWQVFSMENDQGLWYDHPGHGDGYRWVCFEQGGEPGEIQAYQQNSGH